MTSKRHRDRRSKDDNPKKNKRSPAERVRDQQVALELHMRGWSFYKISEQLHEHTGADYTLSAQMIYRDLKALEKDWRRLNIDKLDNMKARENLKLDRIESILFNKWLESIEKPATKRFFEAQLQTQTVVHDDGTTEEIIQEIEDFNTVPRRLVKEIRDESVGDIKWLNAITDIMRLRWKLNGLEAPTKVAPTDPTGTRQYDDGRDNILRLAQGISAIMRSSGTQEAG